MKPLFNLTGKVALITGGSSGLGLAMAEGFLQHGAKVYIAARKLDKINSAVEKLSQYGSCIAIQGDLSTGDGSKALASAFAEQESQLDILVNNAGNTWGAPIEDYPDHAWERVMNLNVRGVFNLTRDLLPLLNKSAEQGNPARVINIGSVAALVTDSLNSYAYATSKAAVHQLTRILAKEFAEQNINVNAIAPGRFPSLMTKYLIDNPDAMAQECAAIPMKRFGELEEIAALAVSLATTAGAYMTGAIIPIDGGANIAS